MLTGERWLLKFRVGRPAAQTPDRYFYTQLYEASLVKSHILKSVLMKVIIIKTLFFIFLVTQAIAQNEILKRGVVDVDHFLDGQYFIIHNGENFKVSILDTNFEIVDSFIRDGDGPGEARSILSVFVDHETRMIYVLRQASVIMVFNASFDLLNEVNFGKNINSSGMVIINQTVFFAINHFHLNNSDESQIVILEYADLTNTSKNGRITIPMEELTIRNHAAINRLAFFRFSSKLVLLDNQIYIALAGHPFLFRFNPKTLEINERIELVDYRDLNFEVVQHNVYGYGFRTPPINNSIFYYNGAIYTSHGNLSLNVRPTLVRFDPILSESSMITNFETMVGSPVIKILDGNMVIHEFMEQVSNYVEILRTEID